MSVINANPLMLGDAGYNIGRSLRFRSSASAYLNRTPASAGNQQKWTWSGWAKLGLIDANGHALFTVQGASGTDYFGIVTGLNAANDLAITELVSATNQIRVATTAVYRDPSAWYHVVVSYDSTAALQDNRLVLYVNNATQSLSGTKVSLNYSAYVNSTRAHQIGRTLQGGGTAGNYFDGYLAEVNFIDGQALTPSSFGQTDAVTGVWTPKKYTGTYGTNGFYLNFSDNTSATTLAYDKSGNGNNWTANNISTTAGATYDSMTDVPTLTSTTAANYSTMNPLQKGANLTVTNGNLRVTGTTSAWASILNTIGMTSGKWYCEVTVTADSGSEMFGICQSSVDTSTHIGASAVGYAYYAGGTKYNAGSGVAYGASYGVNDVVGIAYDADAGSLTFYKNGTSQGVAYSGLSTSVPWFFAVSPYNTSNTNDVNFGQRPFSYTPPTGFKALNTFNLPDPTIKKPNQYMDATTYAGTGVSGLVITNTGGFQPDLVWTKQRNGTDYGRITDAVRGVGKQLVPSVTDAESSFANVILSLNSNGFTVGDKTDVNYNGYNYVGWQWKESATAGFDIVTYTGTGANQNISHSLGVAPKMMIVKARSAGGYSWGVYHVSTGAGGAMWLNATDAYAASSNRWNNTAPTSSVFTVGTDTNLNNNGTTYVAYLFAEIAGFSKFGSYTGNGSADGPFVYCGFRPKYVMIKNATRSTAYTSWQIIDTSREPYNIGSGTVPSLWANNSAVEGTRGNGSGTDTVNYMDILSNGFKIRSAASDETNDNTQTFVYAAFAENPFKYSNAR